MFRRWYISKVSFPPQAPATAEAAGLTRLTSPTLWKNSQQLSNLTGGSCLPPCLPQSKSVSVTLLISSSDSGMIVLTIKSFNVFDTLLKLSLCSIGISCGSNHLRKPTYSSSPFISVCLPSFQVPRKRRLRRASPGPAPRLHQHHDLRSARTLGRQG